MKNELLYDVGAYCAGGLIGALLGIKSAKRADLNNALCTLVEENTALKATVYELATKADNLSK